MPIICCASTLSHKNLEKEVESYINSIKTLKADFVQNSNSETSYGSLYIKKPGKVRVFYEAPKNFVIIIKKNRTIYYNYDLEEYVNVASKQNFLRLFSDENFTFSKFSFYDVSEQEDDIIQSIITLHASEDELEKVKVKMIFVRGEDGSLRIDSMNVDDGVSPPSVISFESVVLNLPISESKFRMANPNFFKK